MRKILAVFIFFCVLYASSSAYAWAPSSCPMMPAGIHQETSGCASHEICCEAPSKSEASVLWASSVAGSLKDNFTIDSSFSILPEKSDSNTSDSFSDSPPNSNKQKLYRLYSDYRI